MAAPFLKWAGGKARLAPLVAERAPARFRRFIEPFTGGGAVFFAMESAGRASSAVLNDANCELTDCYLAVRDQAEALIARLSAMGEEFRALAPEERKAYYYARRAEEPATEVARAARLIFLNRTCYNGLYRVNSQGRFNVPYGRYANPRVLDAAGLRAASHALGGTEISCADFAGVCETAGAGDFVYLDPPYQPLSTTASFTSYTAADFGGADQVRLRDAFEAMTRRGAAAMLSNSDHAAIRELYEGAGYTLEVVAMSRSINSVGAKRAPVPELLISNFGRDEVRAAFASLERTGRVDAS